jgi:hypothetical protein
VLAEAATGDLDSDDFAAALQFAGEAVAERLIGKAASTLAATHKSFRKAAPTISNRQWARENYWMAVAQKEMANPSGKYSKANLARIAEGKAPLMRVRARNLKTGKYEEVDVPMELHHTTLPHRTGSAKANEPWNLQPTTPWGHESMDSFRHLGYELISIVKGPNSF